MNFHKYHALGNDYIVIDPQDAGEPPAKNRIMAICHRNYGIGSDGILFGPLKSTECDFGLVIYNPDGGEAEKSGNGLRIFSRYLWDRGLVGETPFTIMTGGGPVVSKIQAGGRRVTVEMGTVSFDSEKIPVQGPQREVLNEAIEVLDETFGFCAATVGNPHCVIPRDEISAEDAKRYGPLIETDPRFPNRTNVQFMKILDRNNIRIEIWERGAGYTLASGSSSSASAAVAKKLGYCDNQISVHMPGGVIEIEVSEDYAIKMAGSVAKVCEGVLFEEMFEDFD